VEGQLISIDGAEYTITPMMRPTDVVAAMKVKLSPVDEHGVLVEHDENGENGGECGR
jgi:hypothetical protein